MVLSKLYLNSLVGIYAGIIPRPFRPFDNVMLGSNIESQFSRMDIRLILAKWELKQKASLANGKRSNSLKILKEGGTDLKWKN